MNNIDICNLALSQLKVSNILSLDANSEEARQCKRHYDFERQKLLRAHPWHFAKRVKTLALIDDKSNHWKYLYLYPKDCLYILNIFGEGNREDYIRQTNKLENYDIFSLDDETKVIATNIEKAYIEYINDAKDVTSFSVDFIDCLTYKLAATLATPLSASSALLQNNYSLYSEALEKATAKNHNENKEKVHFESEILKARG